MRIQTSTGVWLDDSELACPTINHQIRVKRIEGFHAFVATELNGVCSYVLVDTKQSDVIYATQSLEAISCLVDTMALIEGEKAEGK